MGLPSTSRAPASGGNVFYSVAPYTPVDVQFIYIPCWLFKGMNRGAGSPLLAQLSVPESYELCLSPCQLLISHRQKNQLLVALSIPGADSNQAFHFSPRLQRTILLKEAGKCSPEQHTHVACERSLDTNSTNGLWFSSAMCGAYNLRSTCHPYDRNVHEYGGKGARMTGQPEIHTMPNAPLP